MKPLVFDLYAGLGGWSEAFIAEGYRAIGFDIEAHDYGDGGYPGELVLRDARSISGAELVKQYGVPKIIVASPPCQEFSYMAMPWTKAKEKRRKIMADKKEQVRLTDLFNQCFRIQREVSQAAGHYVPLIIENVRGAQEWVGKARWNFGSFYLWGDVPALMPIPAKLHMKIESPHLFLRDQKRANGKYAPHYTKGEGNKTVGMNWSDQTKRGQDFTRIAGKQAMEGNKGGLLDAAGTARLRALGKSSFGWDGIHNQTSSKSNARKAASAKIAKIPAPLAQWIARCFKQ